jgi:hypothetical protein
MGSISEYLPHRRASGASRGARDRLRAAALVLAAVLLVGSLGVLVVHDDRIALALAALLLLVGVFAADPILLVVIALPGIFLLQRVGGGGVNLSAADLLVFLGAMVGLLHVRWREAPHLRQFLLGVIIYEAVLIVVVGAHPNRYDILEWFHRLSYVGGSVLVGWVIARSGRVRQAFWLYFAAAAVIATITLEHAITLHFHPAQWGLYQKNAIGAMMWVVVVVAQLNPPWAGLRPWQSRWVKYLCVAALLASQSRQSWVVLIGVLLLAYLLRPDMRRRAKLMLLGLVPLAVLTYYTFARAFKDNPKFNSVAIRLDQYRGDIAIWHLSPLLGVGMRFYNLPQYAVAGGVPPSVIMENLASTGVVGSIAFVVLVVLTIRAVLKLPLEYRTLGLVVLTGHYVEGLFDIFWVGAYAAAAFIIVGLVIGICDRAVSQQCESTLSRDMASSLALVANGTGSGFPPSAPPGRG